MIDNKYILFLITLFVGVLIGIMITFYATPYKIYPNHSPSNYINIENIHLSNTSVCIEVENPKITSYANTGSMIPTLDVNSNGIRITPKNEDDIKLGDLISLKDGNDLIIHRVIVIGYDYDGWFVITKGDNNVRDDGKFRFRDIKYKTVAIIY